MNSRKQANFPALLAALAAVFAIGGLIQTTAAGANNPPTTLLGVAAVDPFDDPATEDESPIWAIAEANGRYYIGGQFSEVGGEPQAFLAAIEVATGRLDPDFRPVITGSNPSTTEVKAIALPPDGSALYVGGRFTNVNGVTRNRIAKLDPVTGELDQNWDANADAVVLTIEADSNSVWAGGEFTTIGGQPNEKIARLNTTSGNLNGAWSTTADGNIFDVELAGSDLYVGGNYASIGGIAVTFLARMDAATGAVDPMWTPAVGQKILEIAVKPDGTHVYSASGGSLAGGGNALEAFDVSTGNRVWKRVADGDIQAVTATDSLVYAGTHGQFVFTLHDEEPGFANTDGYGPQPNNNTTRREKFFAVDALNGTLDSWDPHGDTVDGTWEMEIGPSGLLTAGDVRTIKHPTGVTGVGPPIFTPHIAIFPGIGVEPPAPKPFFSIDCAGLSCTFDASASTDDGSIVSYAWDLGNGTPPANGVAASTLYANNAIYTVSLTVVDNDGNSVTTTSKVEIGDGGLPVEHVASDSISQSSNLFTLGLPSSALADDVAIAIMSVKDLASVPTPPADWTQLATASDGQLHTTVWTHTIEPGESGTNVSFELAPANKADLTVSVFRNADTTQPVAMFASTAEIENRVGHRAPALNTAEDSTVVHYWAQRSSGTTEFTAPGDEVSLTTSTGQGGGRIATVTSLVAEPSNATSLAVAIAEHHTLSALGWTFALKPTVGAPLTCNGLAVTVDLALGQSPTSGNDVIRGTSGPNSINGLAGNDTICGLGGADTINGGGGVDVIFGDGGNDVLGGQGGADVLHGGPGNDVLNGGVGDDVLNGNGGDDDLRGQGNADTMNGGAGVDQFFGGSGNDTIQTGAGGNLGTAQVVRGGGNNDTITGSSEDDDLEGGSGLDTIMGLAGNDRLRGGNAFDQLFGGAGNDTLEGGAIRDVLYGGEGNDSILGGTGDDELFGEGGDDTLNGQGGIDECIGGTTGEVGGDSAQLCETVDEVP